MVDSVQTDQVPYLVINLFTENKGLKKVLSSVSWRKANIMIEKITTKIILVTAQGEEKQGKDILTDNFSETTKKS